MRQTEQQCQQPPIANQFPALLVKRKERYRSSLQNLVYIRTGTNISKSMLFNTFICLNITRGRLTNKNDLNKNKDRLINKNHY